jgi:Fe-S-cluster-containing dehydrogenase component
MTDVNIRNIRIVYKDCTGCRACTIVCALFHENQLELNRSRIRVEKNFPELNQPIFQPKVCRMCRNAKCISVCPTEALHYDEQGNLVILDPDLCNGCGLCIEACPFDAIWIDHKNNKALKCDLCGGDPMCIKYCSPGAIKIVMNNDNKNIK